MRETSKHVIGIDWGSSNCRAALISPEGEVVDTRESSCGALKLKQDEFAGAFQRLTNDWIASHDVEFALASGMVGSKQGWLQAPYVNTPAAMDDMVKAVQWFDQRIPVGIVPGIADYKNGRILDILRGEEAQVFGVLRAYGITDGLLILPGTHSKWIHVEQSRVAGFRTYMTGELFDVVKTHSILKHALGVGDAGGGFFLDEFLAGCRMAADSSLLHNLFSMRTRSITTDVAPERLDSYYSGLLIGEEIRDGLGRLPGSPIQTIHIVGSAGLIDLYRHALSLHSAHVVAVDEKIAFVGLNAIADRFREHTCTGQRP